MDQQVHHIALELCYGFVILYVLACILLSVSNISNPSMKDISIIDMHVNATMQAHYANVRHYYLQCIHQASVTVCIRINTAFNVAKLNK